MLSELRRRIGVKLTAIHQIEITSRCNLRCPYCAHPTMPRAKQDMTSRTFYQAVMLAQYFAQRHEVRELNLCGIGESTLHPDFLRFVQHARGFMPAKVDLILATNGLPAKGDNLGWTPALAEAVARIGNCYTDAGRIRIWVSLHRPEKAGPTVELLRRYGLLAGVSADPSISAVDWAGQVDYHVSAPRSVCPWLSQGWGFVMADGRVSTCCFDGRGTDGVLGTVWGDVPAFEVKPYSLCPACHHDVPTSIT